MPRREGGKGGAGAGTVSAQEITGLNYQDMLRRLAIEDRLLWDFQANFQPVVLAGDISRLLAAPIEPKAAGYWEITPVGPLDNAVVTLRAVLPLVVTRFAWYNDVLDEFYAIVGKDLGTFPDTPATRIVSRMETGGVATQAVQEGWSGGGGVPAVQFRVLNNAGTGLNRHSTRPYEINWFFDAGEQCQMFIQFAGENTIRCMIEWFEYPIIPVANP
ncbi:MAG: hypothetical protein ACE5Q3_19610 [Alphaproteobacteria bacterium]